MLSAAKTFPGPRQRLRFWPCALGFAFFWTALGNAAAQQPASPPPDHAIRMTRGLASFQRDISGLLREQCLKCHGGEKIKGGLDLATREGLLKGGDDGSAVVPFDAKASRMLKLARHEDEPHMPDKAPKLGPEAIAQLTAWIDDGAPYDKPLIDGKKPTRDKSQVSEEDRQWWAFQPLGKLAPPATPNGQATLKHPVDAFIAAKAALQGLKLAPLADKRVLIRRAYLDLIGIPPTPEEVETFLTDKSPKAWERVIDHLLDSPRHGERWARHWLDVARFAESTGFEHDYNRPGAYHYRDFVIKALNSNLPYDQFIRWQLAGDEFEPENPLALSATGFLGAGVFPTQITANEVERTRYDALDDMLSTTSQAFLGLTTGCARCHDHKFDPIPVKDYYRMLATFTTTTRAVVDLDLEPKRTAALLAEWDTGRAKLADELSRHETLLQPAFTRWLAEGAPLPAGPRWSPLALTNLTSKAGATFKRLPDDSYLVEGKNGDREEYTLTASGSLQNVTALRLDALSDPSMKKGGPGRADNGNFALSRLRVRVKSPGKAEAAEVPISRAEADFEQNKDNLSIASSLDATGNTGWAIDPQFGKDHSAMFVFAKPLTLSADEQLVVSLEFQVNTRHNIGRPRLAVTDDPQPALPGELLPSQILALLRKASRPGFAGTLSTGDRETLFNWWKLRDAGQRERAAKLAEHLKRKPDGKTKVLICAEGYEPLRHHTQGADFFTNTFYLKRGNSDLKDGVAEAGFLQVLMRGTNVASLWNWQPPAGAKFSGRRRAFANWLTDTDSGAGALAARVAVNRLWQHHFGRGIVTTPNDFGRTGALPSHPELLDWLAGELVRQGWQLKPLHKLLMTSATYMQAAASPVPGGSDQGAALFIGHLPRRLEGEAIRDSIMAVSGKLDATMFGPGTQDERSHRRSIYFTIKRSELIGSMVVFDQPEPLASQGQRPTTTVAPQALFLLNGAPVREWAEALAKSIGAKANPALQINRAYLRTLSRPPTKTELTAAMEFLTSQNRSYGVVGKSDGSQPALADFCQILFALNEFAYVN